MCYFFSEILSFLEEAVELFDNFTGGSFVLFSQFKEVLQLCVCVGGWGLIVKL